jgi:hypothetical protein
MTTTTTAALRLSHARWLAAAAHEQATVPLPDPTLRWARRIRFLIADDHEVVRHGLRAFLDLDPALDVVGEAANGTQAVRLAHRLRPDRHYSRDRLAIEHAGVEPQHRAGPT